MLSRVPVHGQDYMGEHSILPQFVDVREDLVAVGNGKGASLAEVVLNVDNNENFRHLYFNITIKEFR